MRKRKMKHTFVFHGDTSAHRQEFGDAVEVGAWVDVVFVFAAVVVVVVGLGDVDVLVRLGAVIDPPVPMLLRILSHLLFG